jgi:hypothetical protein
MFCPYSGKDHPDSDGTIEHVVAYSIGGSDAFTITASKQANGRAGEEVDCLLTNNFFIATHRIALGLVGQSGRSPSYKLQGTIDVEGRSVPSSYKLADAPQLWMKPEVQWSTGPDGKEQIAIACDLSDVDRILGDLNRKLAARGNGRIDRDAFVKSAKVVSDERPEMKIEESFSVSSFERPFIKMALGAAHFALGEDYTRTPDADRLRAALWEPDANVRAKLQLHGRVWPNVEGPALSQFLKLMRRGDHHVVVVANTAPLSVGIILFGEYLGMIKLSDDVRRYTPKIAEGVAYVIDPRTRKLSTHGYRSYLAANTRALGAVSPGAPRSQRT